MCRPAWHRFFGQWRDIGMMTDDSHHGEGEHDQRDMAVPAVPGTAFVVIEAEFVFGGFETVLDGPAMAFDQDQLFHGRTRGAPGGEEGQITISKIASFQLSPLTLPRRSTVV